MVYVPLDAQPSYPVPADLELLHMCRYVELLLHPWLTARKLTRDSPNNLLGIRGGKRVACGGAEWRFHLQASGRTVRFVYAVAIDLRCNEASDLTHRYVRRARYVRGCV